MNDETTAVLLRLLRTIETARDIAERDDDGHVREGLDEAIGCVNDEIGNAARRCARCRQVISDPDAAPDDDSALCRYCGDEVCDHGVRYADPCSGCTPDDDETTEG